MEANYTEDAVLELEAMAAEMLPLMDSLNGVIALLEANGGDFPQHVPKECRIRIDTIHDAHRSAERTFLRHADLYSRMRADWKFDENINWNLTPAVYYRDILGEKYGLLRKAAVFLRAKAKMSGSPLPTTPTNVTNIYGGTHMRDVHMHNEKGLQVAPGATIEGSNLSVSATEIANVDLSAYVAALSDLRNKMRVAKDASPEHDAAMGQIAEAEAAAKKGDEKSMHSHLKRAGRIALEFAQNVAEGLIVEVKKSSMGLPSGAEHHTGK